MTYENSTYWKGLHRRYPGQLKAVGYPGLSEQFNSLKYDSEAETVLAVLAGVAARWEQGRALSVIDIGAGTGYWLAVVRDWLAARGYRPRMTALDISEDALQEIRRRDPEAAVVHADLTAVDGGRAESRYDLAFSFYCLHHLVRLGDFLNALTFAGRCVKPGGLLMLMDPVLRRSFSWADTFDYYSYEGNGVPRHLYLVDDVLAREGLRRRDVRPAVSFLLNGNIEARGRVEFAVCRRLWERCQRLYRSEGWTRRTAGICVALDRLLKKADLGFSSSVCLYEKREA
jgi:SAM-dependent methyltransferase